MKTKTKKKYDVAVFVAGSITKKITATSKVKAKKLAAKHIDLEAIIKGWKDGDFDFEACCQDNEIKSVAKTKHKKIKKEYEVVVDVSGFIPKKVIATSKAKAEKLAEKRMNLKTIIKGWKDGDFDEIKASHDQRIFTKGETK